MDDAGFTKYAGVKEGEAGSMWRVLILVKVDLAGSDWSRVLFGQRKYMPIPSWSGQSIGESICSGMLLECHRDEVYRNPSMEEPHLFVP